MDFNKVRKAWPSIKAKVHDRYQLSDVAYNLWIRDLEIEEEPDADNAVLIRIPSTNPREIPFYGRKYREALQTVLSETTGNDVKVNFNLQEEEKTGDIWKLEGWCWKGAEDCYSGDIPAMVGERLSRELSYVRGNHSLLQTFITVRNFIIEFALEPYQYSFRGTVGNSLIAYVLGFTDMDPVEYGLDERFFYGANGEKTDIRFEMNLAGADEIEHKSETFTIIPGLYNVGLDCFCKMTGENPDKIIPYDPDVGDYLRRYPDMIGFAGDNVNVDPDVRRDMLQCFKLKNVRTLSDLNALCWGSGIWKENGENLVKERTVPVQDLPRTRDDVFQFLLLHRIDPDAAFRLAENISRGGGIPESTVPDLLNHDVSQWYIDSANKVKYLFPKAHCLIYAEMQWRLAYYYLHFESRLNVKREDQQSRQSEKF